MQTSWGKRKKKKRNPGSCMEPGAALGRAGGPWLCLRLAPGRKRTQSTRRGAEQRRSRKEERAGLGGTEQSSNQQQGSGLNSPPINPSCWAGNGMIRGQNPSGCFTRGKMKGTQLGKGTESLAGPAQDPNRKPCQPHHSWSPRSPGFGCSSGAKPAARQHLLGSPQGLLLRPAPPGPGLGCVRHAHGTLVAQSLQQGAARAKNPATSREPPPK